MKVFLVFLEIVFFVYLLSCEKQSLLVQNKEQHTECNHYINMSKTFTLINFKCKGSIAPNAYNSSNWKKLFKKVRRTRSYLIRDTRQVNTNLFKSVRKSKMGFLKGTSRQTYLSTLSYIKAITNISNGGKSVTKTVTTYNNSTKARNVIDYIGDEWPTSVTMPGPMTSPIMRPPLYKTPNWDLLRTLFPTSWITRVYVSTNTPLKTTLTVKKRIKNKKQIRNKKPIQFVRRKKSDDTNNSDYSSVKSDYTDNSNDYTENTEYIDSEIETGSETLNYEDTKPELGTTTISYVQKTKAVPTIIKCYVCGIHEKQIPVISDCHDVFDGDDGHLRLKRKLFKTHCVVSSKTNVDNSSHLFHSSKWIGGCFKRFTDVGVVYNEKGCRSWPPVMGESFASKRFSRLEEILKGQSDACVVSPLASLIPFARSISLWVRFHVCVCTGDYCNRQSTLGSNTRFILLVSFLVVFVAKRFIFFR